MENKLYHQQKTPMDNTWITLQLVVSGHQSLNKALSKETLKLLNKCEHKISKLDQRRSWWSWHWSVDFTIYIKMRYEAKVTDTVWCEVNNNTVVNYSVEHLLHFSLLEIIRGSSPMCWSGGPQRRTAAPSHRGCTASPERLTRATKMTV